MLPAAPLAVLAILLVPSTLRAATIYGHTRNEGGQPICRVEVTLQPRGPGVSETGLMATTTGEDGEFLFAGVKPGTYRLRIGVYNPDTGNRLTLPTGEDSLVIQGIQIR